MPLSIARRLCRAALPVALLLLSGCGSSRDSAMAEKLARAEQAAKRAEAAQKAAEEAAKAAGSKLEQLNAASPEDAVPDEDEESAEAADSAGAETGPADDS